jgi:hypothetical protein
MGRDEAIGMAPSICGWFVPRRVDNVVFKLDY